MISDCEPDVIPAIESGLRAAILYQDVFTTFRLLEQVGFTPA